MADESTERVLWIWTGPELAALVVLLALLAGSVTGRMTFWSSASRQIRLGVLAVVAVQLLVPLWVYLDLRRRGDDSGMMWVHIAAMPLLNLFGLVAYLDYRQRSSGE